MAILNDQGICQVKVIQLYNMDLFGRLPKSDLEEICIKSLGPMKELEFVNFVIVGASGFLGRWLSTYLAFMAYSGSFKGSVMLIARQPDSLSELKSICEPKTFKIIGAHQIEAEKYLHFKDERVIVFYAASSTKSIEKPSTNSYELTTNLAHRVVGSLSKRDITFVHLSSGGIYDPTARLLPKIPIKYSIQQTSENKYIYEKIALEKWSSMAEELGILTARNPRLFTFYGPGLDLDGPFAISEFLRLGRSGQPILVRGRPNNLRSYLYPTDAIFQLLLQATTETPKYIQVGSANAVSIFEVALKIGEYFNVDVEVDSNYSRNIDNYVPSEVNVMQERSLISGIKKWDRWLNSNSS